MPVAPRQLPEQQNAPSWDDFMSFMQQYTSGSDGGGFGDPGGGLEAFFASLFGVDDSESFALESPAFPSIENDTDRFAQMGDRLGAALRGRQEKTRQRGIAEGERRIQAVPPFKKPPIQQPPPVTPSPRIPPSSPGGLSPQRPGSTSPSPPLHIPQPLQRWTPPPTQQRPPTQPPGPQQPSVGTPGVSSGHQRPPMTAKEYFKTLSPASQAAINAIRRKAGRAPL